MQEVSTVGIEGLKSLIFPRTRIRKNQDQQPKIDTRRILHSLGYRRNNRVSRKRH